MLQNLLRPFAGTSAEEEAALRASHAAGDAETALAILLAEEQEYSAVLERELQSATEALNARGTTAPGPARADRGFGAKADIVESLVDQVKASMRAGTGDRGSSLAFSFRDTSLTREIGHLLYGVIAAHRHLYQFADQCFSMCDTKTVAQYALDAGLTAYTATENDAAVALIKTAEREFGPDYAQIDTPTLLRLAQFGGAWGQSEITTSALAALRARDDLDEIVPLRADILERDLASQLNMAHTLGTKPDYFSVSAAAKSQTSDAKKNEPVRIGLFDYRNPTFPSNNIGDFFQTLGVVAELKRYVFEDLNAPSNIADLLNQPATGPSKKKVEQAVTILPVSRDFSIAQADQGRIWLPVCGWFAHHVYHTHYGFPFAGNILPIFMLFHVARPEMITDEAVDYLKRFEPIGCRDLTTCRLLRDSGVKAFVNGCATLGLKHLGLRAKGKRRGKFVGDYRAQLRLDQGETLLEHLDPDTWLRGFDANIDEAVQFLKQYANAEGARTPLLHCYLPCRSFGTPVKFIHSNMADPRFEGLVGLEDAAVEALHQRFSQKFAGVMDMILEGGAPDEVYAHWRDLCAEDMAATDRLIEEQDATRQMPEGGVSGAAFADLPHDIYGPAERQEGDVNIVFCFDANFADHFIPTFASILAHTDRRLAIWVLGRGLSDGYFQNLSKLFPDVRFAHVDLSDVDYGEVKLLPHISVSTMDRLVAPALMPDVDRALYLDVDILVRGDIGELWDLDMGEAAIAARDSIHKEWNNGTTLVYDLAKRFSGDKASHFRSMLFSHGKIRFDAFNAGILVMDMDKLRSDDFVEKTTRVVEVFGVHDQFALNIYTRENRAKIPPEWNHFASQELLENPKLVHFIGRVKPWTPDAYHAFKSEWDVFAEDVQRRQAAFEETEDTA